MVTCAQKKGSNDIHEKLVENEDQDEDDDENCPKRSYARNKKVHTIFMNQTNRQREVKS